MPVTTAPKPAAEAPPAPGSVRGHNRPPVDVEAVGEFKEAIADLRPRLDQLTEAGARVAVHDKDSAGKVGTFVAQCRAAVKAVDEHRTAVKAPYLNAGRALDQEAKAAAGPVEDAAKFAQSALDSFMREERQREQAEQRRAEEARRAAEAEERARAKAAEADRQTSDGPAEFLANAGYVEPVAPPPPPPPAAPIRSELGNTVSARTVLRAEVTDFTLAFMAVENNEKVREAIEKAVAALVRGGQRDLPGVTIHQDIKANVR